MKKMIKLICKESDGCPVFSKQFRKYEDAVMALTHEYEAFKECLLEDVPAENISEDYREENKASITWMEGEEKITYLYKIVES